MEGHETGQGGEGEEAECARQSWKSELETLGKGPRDRIIPVLGVGGGIFPISPAQVITPRKVHLHKELGLRGMSGM